MSLDTVVEEIRDEARARREEIIQDAEADADEIVAEAEADAEEIVAEAREEAHAEIEQEREQRLSSAQLEAKQMRLEARRDALEEVRDAVEERLVALDGTERESLTRELLDAAAAEFDEGNEVRVYARADDASLVERLLADYDGYSYAGEYDCLGGVVAESDASRVRVNNTFDSILEDVWENNLKDVSTRLFGERNR